MATAEHDNLAPLCACQCGLPVKRARSGKWNKYILGHNSGRKSDHPANSGQFKPGQSGNPAGTKTGSRNRVTLAALNLLENEGHTLTRKALDLAQQGNVAMLKFCLERLVPVKRSDKITLPDMPKVTDVASASQLTGYILDAVVTGRLSPADGEVISRACERHLRALQVGDLEERLAQLEEKLLGKS